MSVDECITRALRFKNSQVGGHEHHSLAWSPSVHFNLDPRQVTVKTSEHRNRRIYTFQADIRKRRCEVSNLVQAQHKHMRQLKKLDRNIFMRQQSHKLGWMTPVYLSTKEIVCFKPGQNSLSVVRISHPEEGETSLTTYRNNWETFVELYECTPDTIRFCCVLEIDGSKGWLQNKLFPMFVEDAIGGVVSQLHAIQDAPESIIKAPTPIQQLVVVDPRKVHCQVTQDNPSWSEEHLRLPKCSPQQKLLVARMKEKFPDATDNSLIRYLMAKEWKLQDACDAYEELLRWREQMKKYTMDDFKSLMVKKMFTYIGKDRMGRPVVYNKASAVVPAELDEELYILFYSYFFEIYIASKMEGYVDRITVIADGEDLGLSNFKISLTKKNLEGLLKYCPERQSRLIAVHANFFGRTVWRVLRPLLPKKTLDKIEVLGYDKDEIMQALLKEIDISVIPQCLGGQNKNLWADCV